MNWLPPTEGTDHATLTGVPCLLSYVGGNPIDEGTAFKVWGGGLMFECGGEVRHQRRHGLEAIGTVWNGQGNRARGRFSEAEAPAPR